jgi:flagellar basal body rod protein FlgG
VGSLGAGSQISKTTIDMSQGPLESTGDPLDVALQGPGFLTVQTAQGTRYTRDGQLDVDATGRLVTSSGDPVLGSDGKPIQIGADSGDLKISTDGEITAAGKRLGTLGVASLSDPAEFGDNLFTGTPGARPAGTTVNQGSLEGSSVNPATVMIDMMVSLRSYESSQRVIQSIDETLSRGIDSGGSVTGGG